MKSLEFEETPAPRDTRLEDRPNEIWVDLPSLENYFEVSNHGRVKRKKRLTIDVLGREFNLPEKMMMPAINRASNSFHNDYTYRFQICMFINNKYYTFQIQRLIYYCFVEKFDLKNSKIFIVPKEGNGLDLRPENLIKITPGEKNQIAYAKGRMYSHFTLDHASKMRTVKASVSICSKRVSQYSLDGKYIATFKTISEAAKSINSSFGRIKGALNQYWRSPGDFYWRYGSKQEFKMETRPEGKLDSRAKKVTKFDFNGVPLKHYSSMSQATKANSITRNTIHRNIDGLIKHAGGFIWRLGHHTKNIDLGNK